MIYNLKIEDIGGLHRRMISSMIELSKTDFFLEKESTINYIRSSYGDWNFGDAPSIITIEKELLAMKKKKLIEISSLRNKTYIEIPDYTLEAFKEKEEKKPSKKKKVVDENKFDPIKFKLENDLVTIRDICNDTKMPYSRVHPIIQRMGISSISPQGQGRSFYTREQETLIKEKLLSNGK